MSPFIIWNVTLKLKVDRYRGKDVNNQWCMQTDAVHMEGMLIHGINILDSYNRSEMKGHVRVHEGTLLICAKETERIKNAKLERQLRSK